MNSILKKSAVFAIILIICTGMVGCGKRPENKDDVAAKAPEKEETEIISLETLKTIPQFKSTDVYGKEVSSEIFKDSKLTLINLWGTWCSPCVAELPDLGKLYEEVKDKGVNVVGVVEDGMKNEEAVKEILNKTNVTFTNIVPDEKFYDDFMSLCGSFPTSLLVGSNGDVVGEIISGARTKEEYMKLIDEALEKLK
ncbi:TlpA disulfide reductase family protein [Tissierella sp. MB52-C2]|uniref:TlpA family protein disulfide reductase n=1 Tax=Tissierella sp. MB52-C2 TaxID=3070999 RepID=UPI00280A84EF|nr:TlpA disulfide reductase family protein [Tissierella sp. MB52-C2]WMM23399.1 TlpA disulfide reductase family protein [Tissierella sp. MB52-C2]